MSSIFIVTILLTDSSNPSRMQLMKICPECSAQYEDSVSFCAQDGRALAQTTVAQTRLCPHCANSIPEDAGACPYCKAEVSAGPTAQWPTREDDRLRVGVSTHRQKFPNAAKAALLVGIVLTVVVYSLFFYHVTRKQPPESNEEALP